VLNHPVENRLALARMLAIGGVGVEIGVHRGHYSEVLLTYSQLSLLYSIDPWAVNYTKLKWLNMSQETCHRETVARLRRFGDRSHILRFPSLQAARLFDDHSLDFVFVDGDHSYKAIKFDLALWGPKVKQGGIFAGHDYDPKFPGVIKAVTEYSQRHRHHLIITGAGNITHFIGTYKLLPDPPSWVIFK
jgi:hypothetical protein